MIFQIMQNGLSVTQNTVLLVTVLVTVLGSMTLHELAHGLVSYMQGDPTAKIAGRLTLNPLKHISTVGMLCMLFCGFGWARPVPVDPRYYKKPKKGMALTAIAGPFINLVVGVSATTLLATLSWLWQTGVYLGFPLLMYMTDEVYETVNLVLYIVLYYNLLLAVFNMLPLPPFDGSRLVLSVLPDRYYFGIMKYEHIIMLAIFLMLWSGMLTGVFEFMVDGIVKITGNAVFFVLKHITKLLIKIS